MLKNGVTPLYIATFKGHEQIVQILLEKGKSNVNSQRKVLYSFFILSLFFIFFYLKKIFLK